MPIEKYRPEVVIAVINDNTGSYFDHPDRNLGHTTAVRRLSPSNSREVLLASAGFLGDLTFLTINVVRSPTTESSIRVGTT